MLKKNLSMAYLTLCLAMRSYYVDDLSGTSGGRLSSRRLGSYPWGYRPIRGWKAHLQEARRELCSRLSYRRLNVINAVDM